MMIKHSMVKQLSVITFVVLIVLECFMYCAYILPLEMQKVTKYYFQKFAYLRSNLNVT